MMPNTVPDQLDASVSQDRRIALRGELDRIRRILAGLPGVRQIIVFGSMASGRVHAWSDLDLVVVLDTGRSFLDRSIWLSREVQPRLGVQFLAYTPAELRALAERPFVKHEILGKGKVLPMNSREEAWRWMDFAREDLKIAELALNAGIFNQTSFHAQQCVAKSLKASLAAAGELLPRTRLIADLIAQLPASARTRLSGILADLTLLDQYYIPTRYPDALPGSLPEGLPNREQSARALAAAGQCLQIVESLLES
jgi:HEPN domain-containing protein/predicted nucleotidyltransferase